MKRFIAALLACFAMALVGHGQAIASTTILPPGQTCWSGNIGTNGMVGLLGTITGGTGGTAGTYGGVALTGGSGSGATANITVAGGAVTGVSILNPGTQYVVGDVLSATSANIGNTTGFSVPVSSVSINSALAGGSVAFYVPNTNTFKQTWQDSNQTVLNTNPVTLDANGCALVYGTGMYRQVVKDSLGNTIYDALTTDTSAYNSTFWAGNAGGTANAITVVDTGFNGTDGTIINFIPAFTNTGATTLNPSSFGNISVVKDTSAGPIALTGGEIIATGVTPNVVSVVYSATQNNFHLLNTVIASASGATAPLCGFSGLTITNNPGTPNSIVNLTASQALMQTPAGLVINRSNVSVSINLSLGTVTSTANGMDGESVGTTQWIYIWLIDNGSAPAGLGSTSSTAPTQPSGFTYKCRAGVVQVDGSGNLYRTKQLGRDGNYVIQSSGNTSTFTTGTPLFLTSDTSGSSWSATSPTLVAIAAVGNGKCAPPTATAALIIGEGKYGAGVQSNVLVTPNTSYGGTNRGPEGSVGMGYPINIQNSGSRQAWILLEGTTIGYAASASGGAALCGGWRDSVNAN